MYNDTTAENGGDSNGDGSAPPPVANWGRCGRKCWTAEDACSAALDAEAADTLSAGLYTLSGGGRNSRKRKASKVTGKSIADAACATACAGKQPKVSSKPLAEADEAWARVDVKEKEIEETMERMARNGQASAQGMDVYSREEMQKMQHAMRQGDRESYEELDPSMRDLSDDEFQSLREMQAEEGAEAVGQQQQQYHQGAADGMPQDHAEADAEAAAQQGDAEEEYGSGDAPPPGIFRRMFGQW